MTSINVRQLVERLRIIEALAFIPRVSSTNAIGRRVIDECIENDIPLPSAVIIAREQFAGRGRGPKSWHSPADKGIYTTTLHTRPSSELGLLPLEVAVLVATFLRETYGVDAQIKWPNDILVGGKKIAGILLEARTHHDAAYTLIGIGINIERLDANAPADSISLADISPAENSVGLDAATESFVEFIDRELSQPMDSQKVLDTWTRFSVHRPGDRVHCTIGERVVNGTWQGIDEFGRAVVSEGAGTISISGGELVVMNRPRGD